MHVDKFKDVLNEFLSILNCIKSFCEKLRDILFFYKNDLFIEILLNLSKKIISLYY